MKTTDALLAGFLLALTSFGTFHIGLAYQEAVHISKDSLGGH